MNASLKKEDVLDRLRPFIISVARSTYTSSNALDEEDLIQVGLMAASEAIDRFDASRGANFRSFAQRCIKQAIYIEARLHCGVFQIPSYIMSLAAKVHSLAKQGLSDEQITERLIDQHRTITTEWVRDLRFLYSRRIVVPTENVQDICKTDEPSYMRYQDIIKFLDSLQLSDLETDVLRLRYVENKTSQETAVLLGFSQGYISKVQTELERKIREAVDEGVFE